MKIGYYSLKIYAEESLWPQISEILGLEHQRERHYLVIIDEETPDDFSFLSTTLDTLEEHEAVLGELGIKKSDILIHVDYEYEGQMNMEFDSQTLLRMGKYGVSLTLSCIMVDLEEG